MNISFMHAGLIHNDFTPAKALEAGVPVNVVAAGLKQTATLAVIAIFNQLRIKLSSENAAKIAEWNVKQKIAADEALATPNMLASLDAMATARGMDRAGLLAVFTAKAVVLEEIVLHIAALEDVRKAEIAALADSDPAIEAAVTQIVADASDDAEAAYAAANAQINGGS